MKVQANGISIEVEDTGGSGTPVLLVMGLGMQLIAWPEPFVRGLADAGYRVLRHDNRDIGLSQYFDHVRTPNLVWQMLRQRLGLTVRAAYGVDDMARDALSMLDALGIQQAHVIGVSMGGMIAQRMAIAEPRRVRSLVSIMSSSGARGLPAARSDVGAAILRRPASTDREALVAHSVNIQRLIASPGYPFDEARVRERVVAAMQRAYHPAGMLRQILAIGSDTDLRARALPRISSPTLVLHGEADVLVPIECGRDMARRIPGARFEAIAGMGHDLPPGVLPVLLGHILPFFQSVDVPADAQMATA